MGILLLRFLLEWTLQRVFDGLLNALAKRMRAWSFRLPILVSRARYRDLIDKEKALRVVVKAANEMRLEEDVNEVSNGGN